MARPSRIEYHGAIYHVLSRGDRREKSSSTTWIARIFLRSWTSGEWASGKLRPEPGESRAKRIIAEELSRWGWAEEELGRAHQNAPGEMAIAARLRRTMARTLKWIKMPGKTGLDWAGYICYQRIVRVSLISERVAGWLWLACLLGLLGVWDLSAKVPSSSLNGKTLPPGCGWNLNNNNGTATRFTVDTLNQLTAGPTSPYTNDNNGNLTGQVNYYAYGYTYDDEDQLTSVIFSGISKSDFKYDGLGRLRQRQEYTWSGGWYLSSTVNYVYDGRRVIQEQDGNNTPTVSYTRGSDLSGGLEGAGGIGGLLARRHGYSGGSWTTHYYYHADGNGNITYIMDANQAIAATYRYDPFGKLLYSSGSLASANVYRFSSKEFHTASGLYYYDFRFYDPNLQRWLNRDPIQEAGGINLYGFAENMPIDRCDLFGLHWIDYIPNWIGGLFNYSGSTYISPDGTIYSKPPSCPQKCSNLAQLQEGLGGYDPSGLKVAAGLLRAGAELNPIVSTFNSGYTVYSGNDAISREPVSTADRVQAGGQAAAAMLPIVVCAAKGVNWKSVPQFGHTFSEHGEKRAVSSLAYRARSLGMPQGQWLDNQKAAEFLSNLPKLDGPASVKLPGGLGRIIHSDGTVVNATRATIVPNRSGGTWTAYPIP